VSAFPKHWRPVPARSLVAAREYDDGGIRSRSNERRAFISRNRSYVTRKGKHGHRSPTRAKQYIKRRKYGEVIPPSDDSLYRPAVFARTTGEEIAEISRKLGTTTDAAGFPKSVSSRSLDGYQSRRITFGKKLASAEIVVTQRRNKRIVHGSVPSRNETNEDIKTATGIAKSIAPVFRLLALSARRCWPLNTRSRHGYDNNDDFSTDVFKTVHAVRSENRVRSTYDPSTCYTNFSSYVSYSQHPPPP